MGNLQITPSPSRPPKTFLIPGASRILLCSIGHRPPFQVADVRVCDTRVPGEHSSRIAVLQLPWPDPTSMHHLNVNNPTAGLYSAYSIIRNSIIRTAKNRDYSCNYSHTIILKREALRVQPIDTFLYIMCVIVNIKTFVEKKHYSRQFQSYFDCVLYIFDYPEPFLKFVSQVVRIIE